MNMKTIKLIGLTLILATITSCSSVFSPVGNETTKIGSKCLDCTNSRKMFRSYGTAEIISGPNSEMRAISQARLSARDEMIKNLGTEGMSIAAQIAKTKSENSSQKGSTQSLQVTVNEAFKQQAYAMVENTDDYCIDPRIVRKGKKKQEQEYVVVKVCIEMSKKEYLENTYRDNKEMFSNASIDFETMEVILSGSVVDK